jgi:hypothetical protein
VATSRRADVFVRRAGKAADRPVSPGNPGFCLALSMLQASSFEWGSPSPRPAFILRKIQYIFKSVLYYRTIIQPCPVRETIAESLLAAARSDPDAAHCVMTAARTMIGRSLAKQREHAVLPLQSPACRPALLRGRSRNADYSCMIAGAAGIGPPVRIELLSFARIPTTIVHTATFWRSWALSILSSVSSGV